MLIIQSTLPYIQTISISVSTLIPAHENNAFERANNFIYITTMFKRERERDDKITSILKIVIHNSYSYKVQFIINPSNSRIPGLLTISVYI